MKRISATAALAILLVAHPVAADDFVFKGDCERARIVQTERPINSLLTHLAYSGVSQAKLDQSQCTNRLSTYHLLQRERSSTQLIFEVHRWDVDFGTGKGKCSRASKIDSEILGTVRFSLESKRDGNVCEIYILSSWRMAGASDNSAPQSFEGRVTPLNPHSFVVSRPIPGDGRRETPISFVAVAIGESF